MRYFLTLAIGFILFLGHNVRGESIVADMKPSPREAKIEWKPIVGAIEYEIEIGSDARLLPLLKTEKSKKNRIKVSLLPGTYFFRLRGIDRKNLPGAWSKVEGFVVNPQPPTPQKPLNKA